MRLLSLILIVVWLAVPQGAQQPADPPLPPPPPFEEWREELLEEARDRGYSDSLLKQTIASVQPLERVIQSDRSQAELVVGFERYYRIRVTPAFVRRGRAMARQHRQLL